MAKLKVAVLYGGASKDYPVSCKSAYFVISNFSRERFDVMPIGITRAGRWLYFPGDPVEIQEGTWEENTDCCSAILSPDPHHGGIVKIMADGQTSFSRIDAVISVLHGKYGECGRIQSLCKLSGVPFAGCGYDSSNACTDKMLTHLLLNKAGIKTANYIYLERDLYRTYENKLDEAEERLPYPVYVKAASCSSSIGANLAQNRDELFQSIKIAFSHHHKVIIEQAVGGRELECVVYGNEYALHVSEIGEIVPQKAALSTNFIQNTAKFEKALISGQLRDRIKNEAIRAFRALNCKVYARISFKLTDDELYCIKLCNIPGMALNSSLISLMTNGAVSYSEILEELISFII